ncbi:hypothetical protein PTKIN_Ptkin10aG0001000 [Pterospermum kingtungense]
MASQAFLARSNSLPSRPHPVIPQIDEHLCRLKSSEAASTSSSPSMGEKLCGLRDLLLDVCDVAKGVLLQAKKDTQELQSTLRRQGDDARFINEAKFYLAFTLFESLFSFISGEKMQLKSSNWPLVSKLMHSKCITCEGQASKTNEFKKEDVVLCTLIDHKTRKSGNMGTENVQIDLQKLESSVQDLEDGVECLLKLLIKTRVSILNILSH